jgi:hypothetical protein
MKKKQETLPQDALRRLPEHDPPTAIWLQIEKKLDSAPPAPNAQSRLPEYDPPSDLWPQIEAAMEAPAPGFSRRTRRRALLIAAAAVALLLVARLGFRKQADPAIRYSQEILYETRALPSAYQADETRHLLDTFCRKRPKHCLQPDFLQMKAELEELSAAQSALSEAMGPYNTDPVLHTELAKIDRAREETIHKMMADYGLRHPDDFD